MAKHNGVTLTRGISRTLSSNSNTRCGGSLTILGKSTSGALLCLNFVIHMVLNDKIESYPLLSVYVMVLNTMFSVLLIILTCTLHVDHESTEKLVLYVSNTLKHSDILRSYIDVPTLYSTTVSMLSTIIHDQKVTT